MPVTSKTGLLPSVKRKIKNEVEEIGTLEMPSLSVPAPFSLRPFTGICNPFPNACSILCNHPTNLEAKSILRRAKHAWISEGKSIIDLDEFAAFRRHEKDKQLTNLTIAEDQDLNVPEELFRKYTNTDSRPLTPAPTLASIATKTTQSVKARRCVTPDPTSFIPTKEKMLLVLDLRRSHSQDTLYYQGAQSFDSNLDDGIGQETSTLKSVSPTSPNTSHSKITRSQNHKRSKGKSAPTSGRASSLKSEISKDSDLKNQNVHVPAKRSSSKGSLVQEQEAKESAPSISPASSSVDLDYIKRRGKKRKGKKTGKNGTKEGEKEFKGIPDPGETQVSAMESDSKEGSLKESLTGEDYLIESRSEDVFSAHTERKIEPEQNISFLKLEILQQLQRQLDQEVVDSELNTKRKIALQEALRCKTKPKQSQPGEEMKNLKKEFQLQIKNSEKWLSIPRAFTRRSARFELPMDSRLLNDFNNGNTGNSDSFVKDSRRFVGIIQPLEIQPNEVLVSFDVVSLFTNVPVDEALKVIRSRLEENDSLSNHMTPLHYVENYVFASPERLVLYNHVFNLYKEEPEDDESTERLILGKNVLLSLGNVMGKAMTNKEAEEFQALLGWKDEANLSFRTFTGICAVCERLMAPKFSSKVLTQEEDPRHEVERADFETLNGKLIRLNPDPRLVKILRSIRDL